MIHSKKVITNKQSSTNFHGRKQNQTKQDALKKKKKQHIINHHYYLIIKKNSI